MKTLIHPENNSLLHIKYLQHDSRRENVISESKNVNRSKLKQDRATVQSIKGELHPDGQQ